MSDKLCKRRIKPSTEGDMNLREILRGLEDVAAILSYTPWPGEFEIVAISSKLPKEKTVVQAPSNPLPPRPGATIISFQKHRSRRRA